MEESPQRLVVELFAALDIPIEAATSFRFVNALQEMLSGYEQDPSKILMSALMDSSFGGEVEVASIPFSSLCKHHLLPFFGEVTVRYFPQGKIVGLSKIPRTVTAITKRLQIQEDITDQIADVIHDVVMPKRTEVEILATHACMMCRGAKTSAPTTTRVFRERG